MSYKRSFEFDGDGNPVIAVIKRYDGMFFMGMDMRGRPLWSPDIRKAKVCTSMKSARTTVTMIVNSPSLDLTGVPVIHRFTVSGFTDINETERVRKNADKKSRKEELYKQKLANKQMEIAQEEYNRAAANLEAAENKLKKLGRRSTYRLGMNTKTIEVCEAVVYNISCEYNDSVDIRAGGPTMLGYNFGVSPDEDEEDTKEFLRMTVRKYHQPLMSVSTSRQKDFPVKHLWTRDMMEDCIRRGY